MRDKKHFTCGHARRNNSTNGHRPQCKQCKTAYAHRRWSEEKLAKAQPKRGMARIALVLIPKPLPLPSELEPPTDGGRSYGFPLKSQRTA